MKILHLVCGVLLFICICHFVPDVSAATDGLLYPYKKCESDNDCTVPFTSCRHLDCEGLVCRCFANMTMDEGGDSCKIPKMLGESCDQSSRCVYSGVICIQNTCKCESGSEQKTANDCVTKPRKGFINEIASGGACTTADRCAAVDEKCINGTCQCSSGYRKATQSEITTYVNVDSRCRPDGYTQDAWNNAMCGFIDLLIGEECGVNNMYACPSNAVCAWKNCTSKMCVCKENYVPSMNRRMCLEDKHVGEACTSDVQCVDVESSCNGTTCVCNRDFTYNGNGRCDFNDPAFFASYNQSCGIYKPGWSFAACMLTTHCDYSNHVCTCMANYHYIKEIDRRYRRLPSFYQCVYDIKFWLTDQEYDEQCVSTTTIPTTTEEVIRVGRNCTADNICPNGSSCITYRCSMQCVCDIGNIVHSNLLSCVPAAGMDEACNSTANCAFSNGECVNGKCQCEAFYVKTTDGQHCADSGRGAPTGSTCSIATDCFMGLFGSQSCTSNMCQCNTNTFRALTALESRTYTPDQLSFKCINKSEPRAEDPCDGTTTTTTPTTTTPTTTTTTVPTTTVTPHLVKIDELCDDTVRLCPANATCEETYNGPKTCRCDSCYYYNAVKTGCLALKFYGEDCDHDVTTKCGGGISMHCSKITNKCDCGPDYKFNKFYCLLTFGDNHMNGRYDGPNGETTPSECDSSSKHCESRKLTCTSGRCQCASGYRDADANDRCAAPTLNRNCVPSNWTSGYRPQRGSPEAQLLKGEDISLEEIMKRIENEKAQREEAENRETTKLIIAACISAVGVFMILMFIAVFVRRVLRKRQRKDVDDASTRSDSSRIALFRGFTAWLSRNYNKPVQ